MAYKTKLKLIDAKMEQPSGGVLTLSGGTTIASGGAIQYEVNEHGSFTDRSLVDKEYVDSAVTGGTEIFRFTEDIVVSIEEGKTFGRYENGDTIPASGLTPNEVILLATQEPIDPTVNLSHNAGASDVTYGQEDKEVSVVFSYDINSLGASVDEFELEWRRGTSGGWTLISDDPNFTSPYLLEVDDTGDRFNTTVIQLRLRVKDTQGAETIATHNVNPQTFAAGSMSINIANAGLESYETNFTRERGNTESTVTGSVNATNQPLNTITQYIVERQVNGGSYTTIDTVTGLDSNNVSVTAVTDTAIANTANNARYRITFTYQDGSTSNIQSTTINFRFAEFFNGNSTLTSITNSTQLQGLNDVRLLASATNRTETNVDPDTDEYVFYAYPASFGALTGIELNGSSPVLGGFTQQETAFSFTNTYGVVINYRIYRSNSDDAFSGDTLEFQF